MYAAKRYIFIYVRCCCGRVVRKCIFALSVGPTSNVDWIYIYISVPTVPVLNGQCLTYKLRSLIDFFFYFNETNVYVYTFINFEHCNLTVKGFFCDENFLQLITQF